MSIESLKTDSVRPASLLARADGRGVNLVFLGALAASFFVAYLPTYLRLAGGAWRTEQEGHGPLIMLAAAWLAWQQRDRLKAIELRPALVAGWIILLLSLLLMAVTRSQDIPMIEVATQIPVLLGCLLLIGGWPLARVFAFPLAFLIFSVPPPNWLLDAFTVPLKVGISDIVFECPLRSRLSGGAERRHDYDWLLRTHGQRRMLGREFNFRPVGDRCFLYS
jgi:hypothetical protein